jgi:hypothetical protein
MREGQLARLVWLPIGKPPDQLIDLEAAVEQVVAANYGTGFVAEWTPATLQGEYEAQTYGGVRTLAWQQARDWILGHLQRGKLKLLRVSNEDPPVIRACSSGFWRSSDHDDIQRQKQILDRSEDPSRKWTYALDEALLTSLLGSDVSGKVQKSSPEPMSSISLEAAIKQVIEVKGRPPRDIHWKSFCHEVRMLCEVSDNAYGYGDKTIRNRVGKLGSR